MPKGRKKGKMTMTIEQFCEKHDAYSKGREWALETGDSDMAAIWNRADIKPEWRVWIATRPGVMDDRTLPVCVLVRSAGMAHADRRAQPKRGGSRGTVR